MQRKVPSAITNITLNRATFTDVSIDGLTFVNFFYGNNGAGKSSIAHAIEEDDGIVWAGGKTAADFDVLVYNQDFINDNFVNYGDLKGVFIFGEEDIEAKKKIAELTDQKKQKMDARQAALDEYKRSQTVSRLHYRSSKTHAFQRRPVFVVDLKSAWTVRSRKRTLQKPFSVKENRLTTIWQSWSAFMT